MFSGLWTPEALPCRYIGMFSGVWIWGSNLGRWQDHGQGLHYDLIVLGLYQNIVINLVPWQVGRTKPGVGLLEFWIHVHQRQHYITECIIAVVVYTQVPSVNKDQWTNLDFSLGLELNQYRIRYNAPVWYSNQLIAAAMDCRDRQSSTLHRNSESH